MKIRKKTQEAEKKYVPTGQQVVTIKSTIVDDRTVEQKVDDLTKRFNRLIEALTKSKYVGNI